MPYHAAICPASTAVGLRVPNVRQAVEFYQEIGFTFLMAVPDEDDGWLLCLLRCGSASILLGALDHPQFPRTTRVRRSGLDSPGVRGRIDVEVPDVAATYAACVNVGCHLTVSPRRDIAGPWSFSCLDPFGYEWRFTQMAEREACGPIARVANAIWS